MADRTVTARLVANVTGLQAGLATGAASVRAFSSELEQNARKNSQGFQQVGLAVGAMGAAALLGVGMAINAFAEFDQQMSFVQAATHESAGAMDELKEAALEAGARTAFSATEAAGGLEELAKAGLTTADIMGGGLAGALDLAAAGGLGVAEAAETMATALSTFNLEGDQASHVADLLAAAAGKAQGDVHDMGAALNQSALLANNMGVSIESATGALALFAAAGLKGSDAGTSFRSMLLHLSNPTKEARDAMADLGISVYDAQGNFVGLEDLAGQLQSRMTGLDQETRDAALATIFGADAVRAASILYQEGSEGVAEWAGKVDDAGYAAETAALRMDNLRGDLEKLSGSVETALIGLGERGDGIARGIVQGLTDIVNAFGEMPEGAQTAVLAIAGIVGVVGLLGGAALILIPKIHATTEAFKAMGATAAGTRAALVGLGSVMAGLFVGNQLGAWLGDLREATDQLPEIDKLADSLRQLGTSGQVSGELLDVFGADLDGLTDRLGRGGFVDGLLGAAQGMKGFNDSVDRVDQGLAALVDGGHVEEAARAFAEIAAAAAAEGISLADLIAKFPQFAAAADTAGLALGTTRDLFVDITGVQRDAIEGIDGFGPAYASAAAAAGESSTHQVAAAEAAEAALQDQEDAVRGVLEASRDLAGMHMSAAEASAAYQQSLDDLDKVMADIIEEFGSLDEALLANGAGFDQSTQAGRDLEKATFDVAKNLAAQAQATWDLADVTGGDMVKATGDLVTSLTTTRDNLIDTMVEMGISEEAARTLADQIVDIPDASETELLIEDAEAKRLVAEQEERLRLLALARTTRLLADPSGAIEGARLAKEAIDSVPDSHNTHYTYTGGWVPGGPQEYAEGGYVPARQGGTMILAGEAGEGEWVIPESDMAGLLSGTPAQQIRGSIPTVQFPAYMAAPPAGGDGARGGDTYQISMPTYNPVAERSALSRMQRADLLRTAGLLGEKDNVVYALVATS